ncbi:TadE/TadG family type IV pilus assembly protein [Sediminibacillus massiliensis]|uniref:TadE/TadG family type IV pilus assembly protein n=1 Tax=Sediminibacillus massiliensis TaxID=1926277 RepID=UPI001FE6A81A|nr:TadE/TadG family type IV pilus assembly protein [Sediminibacillus massiliensis]
MRKLLYKLTKKEDGNALVLTALAMAGMLAMVGLVIDGGHLYMTKSHLQKTANATALSGAQEIPNTQASVNQVVNEVLTAHGEKASLLGEPEVIDDQLEIVLQKDVPVFFSSIFGVESVPIEAKAKAGLNPLAEAAGAVPLGIDESVELNYGQPYTLKVDAGDSTSGNFGVLALEGPGAKLYEDTLINGFDESLKIGDIVNTQTGNIAGKTSVGVNTRIANCPYPDGEYQHRDCSRIMLILVYKPTNPTENQMKSVEITGFAYFYLTEPMGKSDDSIKGIFIRRAGSGTSSENNPPDKGAYAIKLTE